MRELFLHIGAHKTATTSIQAFLQSHHEHLEMKGIRYLPPREIRSGKLVELLHVSRAPYNASEIEQFNSSLCQQLSQEPYSHFVISDENILGAMLGNTQHFYKYADQLAVLIRHIKEEGHRLTALLMVREQISFLQSCYRFRLSRKFNGSLNSFLGWIDLESLSWFRIVHSLHAVLGDDLHVLPYELLVSDMQEFKREIGGVHACFSDLDELPVRLKSLPSLSAWVLTQLRIQGNSFNQKRFNTAARKLGKLVEDSSLISTQQDMVETITSILIENIPKLLNPKEKGWQVVVRYAVHAYLYDIMYGTSPDQICTSVSKLIRKYYTEDNQRLFREYMKPEWFELWQG